MSGSQTDANENRDGTEANGEHGGATESWEAEGSWSTAEGASPDRIDYDDVTRVPITIAGEEYVEERYAPHLGSDGTLQGEAYIQVVAPSSPSPPPPQPPFPFEEPSGSLSGAGPPPLTGDLFSTAAAQTAPAPIFSSRDPFRLFGDVATANRGVSNSNPLRLGFNPATGRLDERFFPPAATHNRQDIERIRSTSPERVLGRAVLDTVTGLLGEGTAATPTNASDAATNYPRIGYGEQAINIAVAGLPVEKLLGAALRNIGLVAPKGSLSKVGAGLLKGSETGMTAAEREATVIFSSRPLKGTTTGQELKLGSGVGRESETFLPEIAEHHRQAPGLESQIKGVVSNHARGNFGERMATSWLETKGHEVVFFKPDVAGTTSRGFDMVTLKRVTAGGVTKDTVFFVDNKALTRTGNVRDVSALMRNFNVNKADFEREVQSMLSRGDLAPDVRSVLERTQQAINAGNTRRWVTNANLSSSRQITGITDRLSGEGIEFRDVYDKDAPGD